MSAMLREAGLLKELAKANERIRQLEAERVPDYTGGDAELLRQRVPEGWKPVPIEPTQKMMGFGAARHGSRLNLCMNDAALIYEAMLAAAPAQENSNG